MYFKGALDMEKIGILVYSFLLIIKYPEFKMALLDMGNSPFSVFFTFIFLLICGNIFIYTFFKRELIDKLIERRKNYKWKN